MPTRILREGILTSERVNALDEASENFYRRLMSVVDDYGRHYAHPALLRAACYPLKLDHKNEADVKRMLSNCISVGLLSLYGQEKYVQLLNFKQQTRAVSKFPEPSENELLNIRLASDEANALGVGVGVGVGGEGEGEGEGDKRHRRSKDSPPDLPEEVKFWNSHELPRVLSMSSDRQRALAARRREHGWGESYRKAVGVLLGTPFCMGSNDRNWRADFDFIIRPGSVTKILEGKYGDRGAPARNHASSKPIIPTEEEILGLPEMYRRKMAKDAEAKQ